MSYNPRPIPPVASLEELQKWVYDELHAISQDQNATTLVPLQQVGHAPAKPRAGIIVSADGVGWNPGAGAGAYEFKGGLWVKL